MTVTLLWWEIRVQQLFDIFHVDSGQTLLSQSVILVEGGVLQDLSIAETCNANTPLSAPQY